MNEKIYKTVSGAGACSLTMGILVLAGGITAGVLLIINGAKLLRRKTDIMI